MNIRKIAFHVTVLCFFTLSLLFVPTQLMAEGSPCHDSLRYLNTQYDSNPATRKAFDKVYTGLVDLPAGYSYNGSSKNPWKAAGSGKETHRMMVEMFETWCTALPGINGDSDNATANLRYHLTN